MNSKGLGAVILVFLLFTSFYINAQNPTVINDSLIVNNRVYAKEKLIVDQEAKFKQDIKVLGSARIQTDLRVDSTLRVDGTAKFFGNVKMEGLGNTGTLTSESEIIVILPNGQLKKGNIGALLDAIYAPPASLDYCGLGAGTFPQWWGGPNKLFTPCPDVKVGIRTDNPLYPLHVVGTSYAQKYLTGNISGSTNALFNGISQNGTEDLIRLGVKIGSLSENIRFTVAPNGNIIASNIGNQPTLAINNGTGHAVVVYANNGSKIFQLQNDGLVRTREIRVDAQTWADFVFAKDYDLPKLKDVAKFIDANHRLPGVPSSNDIKANGINIGEIQTLQMQKIEELTLYMIEMDEKMAAMQNEINLLKEENTELKSNNSQK